MRILATRRSRHHHCAQRTAGQKRSKAKSRFEKVQHVVHLPLSIWAAAPRTTQNTWWLVAARLQRSCVAADPHHSENSGGCLPHDSKNTNQSRFPLRQCRIAKQNTRSLVVCRSYSRPGPRATSSVSPTKTPSTSSSERSSNRKRSC